MIYAIFGLLIILTLACAYRGVFGIWVWTWCRVPFAILGGLCLQMAGINLPPPREIEREEEVDEVAEVQTQEEEPGDPENRWGKQKFALCGLSPSDVKRNVLAEAASQTYDPELDFTNDEIPPKEPFSEFVARRRLERMKAS